MAGEAEAALGGGGSRRRWRSPASVRKEEEEVGSAEWAERPNMPVGWLGRVGRNLKRISFRNFFGFLNISRLYKFVQGDLGGILMWRFFVNSSSPPPPRILEKYNMPCHEMNPMQDYFWKDFCYRHGNSICILYALQCWQKFILVKGGCYRKFGIAYYKYPYVKT
jgi:hypothetical protein